jgi:hypothetical protein
MRTPAFAPRREPRSTEPATSIARKAGRSPADPPPASMVAVLANLSTGSLGAVAPYFCDGLGNAPCDCWAAADDRNRGVALAGQSPGSTLPGGQGGVVTLLTVFPGQRAVSAPDRPASGLQAGQARAGRLHSEAGRLSRANPSRRRCGAHPSDCALRSWRSRSRGNCEPSPRRERASTRSLPRLLLSAPQQARPAHGQ